MLHALLFCIYGCALCIYEVWKQMLHALLFCIYGYAYFASTKSESRCCMKWRRSLLSLILSPANCACKSWLLGWVQGVNTTHIYMYMINYIYIYITKNPKFATFHCPFGFRMFRSLGSLGSLGSQHLSRLRSCKTSPWALQPRNGTGNWPLGRKMRKMAGAWGFSYEKWGDIPVNSEFAIQHGSLIVDLHWKTMVIFHSYSGLPEGKLQKIALCIRTAMGFDAGVSVDYITGGWSSLENSKMLVMEVWEDKQNQARMGWKRWRCMKFGVIHANAHAYMNICIHICINAPDTIYICAYVSLQHMLWYNML